MRALPRLILPVVAVASCGPHNGPRVFRPVEAGSESPALAEAVAARLGGADRGVVVHGVYRWSPVEGRELLVWVACGGDGMSRACAVAAGVRAGDGIRVLAVEPTGWSIPTLSDGPDRAQLMAQGDEGRGTWRQMFVFEADTGRVSFQRRVYDTVP